MKKCSRLFTLLLIVCLVISALPLSTEAIGTLTVAQGSTLSIDTSRMYITGVSDCVDANTLRSNFVEPNDQLVLIRANGYQVTDGYAGTGVKLRVNGVTTYTVIVKSDINGDGEVTVTDYLMIKRTISNNYSLTAAQSFAADINGKDGVDMADYTQTKLFFKGTRTALYEKTTPLLAKASDNSVTVNGTNVGVSAIGGTAAQGTYEFTNILRLELNTTVASDFNKFKLTYTSNQDLCATVYYTYNNASYSEEFFLEPSENGSFSGLIDSYLANGRGKQLKAISFKSICGNKCKFSLKSIDTLVYTVYNSNVVYVENSAYKIGVKPAWGGGMSYLEDKNDGDSTITNLLNNCDAGRLVQQSYYGTSSAPYVCEMYGQWKWVYNPVQGGDQYNNKSKLVDIEIGTDYIYVKSRPLDWAKKNTYTFSYMENTYKLTSFGVKVDNRFIDFSTYIHVAAEQEIPAFYVISHLGTFSYYDGNAPWTNGALTVKSSLPYWGTSRDQCHFELTEGNTETWCAWTNSANYGVGLYTPDAEILLAGRHSYNGSKDPANGATSYVAPIRNMKIQNFEPWEYSYLITTGKLTDIRATFKANKDLIDNTAWRSSVDMTKLTFDSNSDVFKKMTGYRNTTSVSFDAETKALRLSVSEEGSWDPYVEINYTDSSKAISADKNKFIVLTYMIPSGGDKVMELFLCAGDTKAPVGGKSTIVNTTGDGQFRTIIVDCSSFDYWNGNVNIVRLDYFTDASALGASFLLKGLGFASTRAEAETLSQEFLNR